MKQHSNEYLRRFGKKRNRLVRFMVGLFLVCIAFAAGFIVRGNEAFLTRLGFETAANSIDANPGMTVQGDTRNSLSARISEVEGVLEQRSMDDFDLDVATTDILNIISDITDDPYVSYLDQSHYETYLSSASNSYQGIGVLFSEVDGKAYAVDVFGGSDAEANDVRAGDFVVAIDGDRGTGGWTQAEVVRELNQKVDGETTVITWRRPASLFDEGGNEYTVELKVSQYEEPNVTVELVDGEVGYIKLSQITSNSTELVEEAVKNLQEAGATCYVLDLRNNPGGYLTQAVDIGSLFLKSGVMVKIETKDSPETTREADTESITDAPLVIIINGKTAAAAEVLAGGLQDQSRATVVGETSMGKGSVQSIYHLSFGGALRYTSAYYKTPNGYEINNVGISPDVQVAMGSSSSDDAQKSLAVDTAKSLAQQS